MNLKMFVGLVLLLFAVQLVHGATMHPQVVATLESEATVEAAILLRETPRLRGQASNSLAPHVKGVFTQAELQALEKDPNVLAIEPNRMLYPILDETTRVIGARPHVWDLGLSGAGQTVCVIDSGTDYTHPALGGCLGPDCKVLAGFDPNREFSSGDFSPVGHGTHISGTVASEDPEFTGVAPGANLAIARVCEPFGGCAEFDVAAGMDWCVENKDVYDISVISMSLGVPGAFSDGCLPTSVLSMSILEARNAGLLVVIASGNDGLETGVSWPACATGATSVGATDDLDQIASFTNRGSGLDLLAPGVQVTSTSHTWDTSSDFRTLSGTSMSAPHVAGAAAILLELSDMSVDELEQLMKDTGVLIDQWPRIDVLAAVESIGLPGGFCASTVEGMPATCDGGTITEDILGGCRTLVCEQGEDRLEVLACDKPSHNNPDFFEMYLRDSNTDELTICLGETCISDNGFARSPELPICEGELATLTVTKVVVNDDGGQRDVEDFPLYVDDESVTSGGAVLLSPGTYTVSEDADLGYEGTITGDCAVDGSITLIAGETATCTITNDDVASGVCYESVSDIPATCEGVITFDSSNGCRTIVCEQGERSTQVLACNKPGNNNPSFFEMYKQDVTGEPLEICLHDACISDNGFVRSDDFPICVGTPPVCTDEDEDEYAVEGGACGPADCDDTRWWVNPGVEETCNERDDNCDGQIDEGCDDVSVTLTIAPWFPQGLNVVFVCEVSGFTPARYDWEFGDGASQGYGDSPDVWHTYDAPGEYTASCSAWNSEIRQDGELLVVLE